MKREETLNTLKGVGPKTAELLEKAGFFRIGDLAECYPRDYDSFEELSDPELLTEDTSAAVCGSIQQPVSVRHIRGLTISTTQIDCGGTTLDVTWFHMPYLKNTLKVGQRYVFRGKVERKGMRLSLRQPAMYDPAAYDKLRQALQPVYRLPDGISNNLLRKLLKQIFSEAEIFEEFLPEEILKRYGLDSSRFALEQIHFPKSYPELTRARRRLVFDEFLLFILMVRGMKEQSGQWKNSFEIRPCAQTDAFVEALPFSLTNAQQRTWKQIREELQKPKSMSRLVQGDVGSGKTVIAELAMMDTAASGYQSALMAPTEVLARQHYEDLVRKWTSVGGDEKDCALLTGSVRAKEKREIQKRLKNGEIRFLVGTHAIFQDTVEFDRLALVITDEQHRFGVLQREKLSEKGDHPHILVMSATPIPRTLAVILYGDLDISVIDELPAKRLPIKNCVVGTEFRQKAYAFMEKEIEQGHQVYIICPMVEESENVEAENVGEYVQRLETTALNRYRIEGLHGKMKPKEKNAVMEAFAAGEIQILVSTTVIEVGINVPNATVMMVENAERFGLAQLHQLRGRVGRGDAQSYCIFMYGNKSKNVKERLEVLNKSNDGFEIASKDMQMRGPGDLFGVRQSGDLDFRIGDIIQDAKILEAAAEAAEWILSDHQWKNKPQYAGILARMQEKQKSDSDTITL